jgi:hypothetical protein
MKILGYLVGITLLIACAGVVALISAPSSPFVCDGMGEDF